MNARRAACREPDDGFTLIEVIVAMFVTVLVMTALTYAVISSLTTIQQARQRQTATALATQQLERLRALPYDTVTQPDGASTVEAGLQYVTSSGAGATFAPASALLPGVAETLVVNTVSGQWDDVKVDRVTYRVQTYVTRAVPTLSGSQTYNLTAIVRWTSSVSPEGRETVLRSTTFSPAGCLSTVTSPFAAPCQAYYTIRAGESLSGVTITNPVDSSAAMLGLDASKLQLDFATVSSNFLVEQTATGNAGAVTSAASTAGSGAAETGGEAAGVAVDSDPSSVPAQSLAASTPPHSSATLTASGTGGTLALRPSTSDSGSARAAIFADAATCVGAKGVPLTTGPGSALRACASSTQQTAGAPAALTYTAPDGTGLTLATFGTTGAPSRAVAAVLAATNSGVCAGGGVIDCAHAASSRSIGAVGFGTDSFTAAPAGFTSSKGLWSLDGIREYVQTEEGSSALPPAFTRSGTLVVWTGSGYQSVALANYATPATGSVLASETWDVPTTTVRYGGVEVDYAGSVTVQRPSVKHLPETRTGVVATDCKVDACETSVDASGSVTSQITVTIRDGATVLTTFAVVSDLGGLTAQATYKAAANG
jgi:prepilin-type N-terminal cleavage/methylation domain-containing protein